jgi:uncharacterized protein
MPTQSKSMAGDVVDADIHNVVPSVQALFPYLSDHWREYISTSAFKGPTDTAYPPGASTTVAPQWRAAGGAAAGTSVDLVRAHVLDALDVGVGILNCAYALDSVHNPDSAAALASAINDWQIAEWLEPEPRLRASIVVPNHYPPAAAQEIERVGDHPGFVQVVLPARSEAPYGNRRYHPIFEAAVRHDLVVGIQFGGSPGNPSTGAGWPSFYIEEYVGMSHVFQSQVLSMIVEGVFDRFPSLRVALIESGWTWLPSLMWRLDKDWKGLRREVPWNTRVPSEYIKAHMRLTTQPIDPAPNVRDTLRIVDQLVSDELLMFASDYPHWRFDDPADAFPLPLSEPRRRRIMSDNARQWYRL